MESFTIVNRILTLVAKRNSGKKVLVKHQANADT
jgi:hypothetical protein